MLIYSLLLFASLFAFAVGVHSSVYIAISVLLLGYYLIADAKFLVRREVSPALLFVLVYWMINFSSIILSYSEDRIFKVITESYRYSQTVDAVGFAVLIGLIGFLMGGVLARRRQTFVSTFVSSEKGVAGTIFFFSALSAGLLLINVIGFGSYFSNSEYTGVYGRGGVFWRNLLRNLARHCSYECNLRVR